MNKSEGKSLRCWVEGKQGGGRDGKQGPHTSSFLCPSLGVPLRSQWHSRAAAVQHKTSGLGGSLDLGLGTGQGEASGAKAEAQGRGWAGLSPSGRQAQPPAPEKWAVKSTAQLAGFCLHHCTRQLSVHSPAQTYAHSTTLTTDRRCIALGSNATPA